MSYAAEIQVMSSSAMKPAYLALVPSIDFLGPLPSDIQQITIFSAGIQSSAKEPAAAKALIEFLTAPAAAPVIRKTGMEPA